MPAPVLNLPPLPRGAHLAQEGPCAFVTCFLETSSGSCRWVGPWPPGGCGCWGRAGGFGLSFGIELGQFCCAPASARWTTFAEHPGRRARLVRCGAVAPLAAGPRLAACAAALALAVRRGLPGRPTRRLCCAKRFGQTCCSPASGRSKGWMFRNTRAGSIGLPLAGQSIRFAFIKTTEGSSSADPAFAHNRRGAAEAGSPWGPTIFSASIPPAPHRPNFLAALGGQADALPPGGGCRALRQLCLFPQSLPARCGANCACCWPRWKAPPAANPSCMPPGGPGGCTLPRASGNIRFGCAACTCPPPGNGCSGNTPTAAVLPGTAARKRFIDLNAFCGGEQAWHNFSRGRRLIRRSAPEAASSSLLHKAGPHLFRCGPALCVCREQLFSAVAAALALALDQAGRHLFNLLGHLEALGQLALLHTRVGRFALEGHFQHNGG